MTSKLVLDNLAGRTTAGSITIVGEGNSTTTNLQQGLAKSWNSASNAAVTSDSLNQSSSSDNGTGDYTYVFTNAMSNTGYCADGTVAQDNGEHFVIKAAGTPSYHVKTEDGDDGSSASDRANNSSVHGDLA